MTGGDQPRDGARRDAQPTDASPPAHDLRVQRDSIQHFHERKLRHKRVKIKRRINKYLLIS